MTGLLRRFLIALADRSPAFTPKPAEMPGFVGVVRRDDQCACSICDQQRQADAAELLAYASAAAIQADGWRGDIGPAVKAVAVAMLRRHGDDMADFVESQPCHIHIEGRE